MRNFFKGFNSHFRAMRLLATNARIRRLALTPFLINATLFIVGIPFAVWESIRLVDSLFSDSSWWLQALAIVLQILVICLVVLGALFLFTLIGTIIAGPFNGPLSAAVERVVRDGRGLPMASTEERGIARDVWRGVIYEIGRLILFLLIYPFIFATQFIPAIGPFLHPVLAFFYAVFVLSVDFSDPVLDRHLERFRDKLSYVYNRKGRYLGFGSGALLMMLVPFVNLLVIPVCVVAATLLYAEESSSS